MKIRMVELQTGKLVEFPWGKIIHIYYVGHEYTIVEYHPRGILSVPIEYHGYINDKDTNRSWDSLDAAIVGCIARKHEGPNHRADVYFMRMIREEV